MKTERIEKNRRKRCWNFFSESEKADGWMYMCFLFLYFVEKNMCGKEYVFVVKNVCVFFFLKKNVCMYLCIFFERVEKMKK